MKRDKLPIETDGHAVPKERQRDMTTFAIPSVPAAPRAGFGRIAEAAQSFFDRQRTRRALSRLDAHLMRDIGVTPPPEDPVDAVMRKVRVQW